MRVALLLVILGACGGGPSVPGGGDDDGLPPGPDGGAGGSGRFQFSWEITIGGATATCGSVGAIQVQIRSTDFNTGDEVQKTLSCAPTGTSTTDLLPAATYDNEVSLLDGDGFPLQSQFPGTGTIVGGDTLTIPGVVFEF